MTRVFQKKKGSRKVHFRLFSKKRNAQKVVYLALITRVIYKRSRKLENEANVTLALAIRVSQ